MSIIDRYKNTDIREDIYKEQWTEIIIAITRVLSFILILQLFDNSISVNLRISLFLLICTLNSDFISKKLEKVLPKSGFIYRNKILIKNIIYSILMMGGTLFVLVYLLINQFQFELSMQANISLLAILITTSLCVFLVDTMLFEMNTIGEQLDDKVFNYFTFASVIYVLYTVLNIETMNELFKYSLLLICLLIALKFVVFLVTTVQNLNVSVHKKVYVILKIMFVFIGLMYIMNLIELKTASVSFYYEEGVLNEFTLLYYTIINITSVGFGDITPLSFEAMLISIVSSVLGFVILFSIIASILTSKANDKYSSNGDVRNKEEEQNA